MIQSTSLCRTFGLLVLLLLCRCAAPPAFNCKLSMVAQLPLTVQDHLLIVPAGINGHWVRLVVDTGAERTVVSQDLVKRLHLPRDAHYTTRSIGVGGVTTSNDVNIDHLVLGGVHFPVSRVAAGSLTLHTQGGLDADGLLGADILLAFEVDIDVPAGRLTLYRTRVCPDTRPAWSEASVEISGITARRDRLLVPFELDGASGMAFLDTGAQSNVLGVDMARRMGLTEQVLSSDPRIRQRGVGPSEIIARLHRFHLLQVGSLAEIDPAITVLPTEAGVGDALIGEEYLQGRRVWISFRNRQVFVTRRPGEQ